MEGDISSPPAFRFLRAPSYKVNQWTIFVTRMFPKEQIRNHKSKIPITVMNFIKPFSLLFLSGTLSVQASLTDGLVAYWDFEGNANNNGAATGGSAYNGTLMGDAAIAGATVKVGTGALTLDGANDYLDVTSIPDPNQPWSVSAWFRARVAPEGSTRFMVFETSGSFPMSLGLREGSNTANTNFQSFSDVVPGTDVQSNIEIADVETAGIWHHVLHACIPPTPTTAGSIAVYIDGTLRSTLNIAAGNTLGTANGFHIGTFRDANGRWFDGEIDEVAIWNRTLALTEAQDVYQRGSLGESLTLPKFTVTLAASPSGTGTVSGGGSHATGASVPITATPNPGHVFTAWDGDFTGQPASFTHTVTANTAATAIFGEDTADPDNDGLTNYQEIVIHQTLPDNPDTDGDGIPDGAEIQIGTSPTFSDEALVNFVRNNLSGGSAGGIALSTPRISRDHATGEITLTLGLSGSADQSVWQAIDLTDPSVSVVPAGNGWSVTIPAPSSGVNSYILTGSKP